MEVFDILLDENFDIQIKDGDLLVGETTLQNQNLLLLSEPGSWIQYPTIGIGLPTYLLDNKSISELKSAIAKGFENDGMRIDSLKISSDYKLTVTANYK